jgi:hypothetical protein
MSIISRRTGARPSSRPPPPTEAIPPTAVKEILQRVDRQRVADDGTQYPRLERSVSRVQSLLCSCEAENQGSDGEPSPSQRLQKRPSLLERVGGAVRFIVRAGSFKPKEDVPET